MTGSRIKPSEYSLASVPIFRDLTPEDLDRIKQLCRCRRYSPSELIIDHLDTSDDVFFLLAGNARVIICSAEGKTVSFRELAPGGMFGEYAAIDGRPRSARVEAQTSCLIVSMKGAAFRQLAESEPTVAKVLLKHFVTEIRELTTRVYEFSTLAVRYRIQTEVLRLARASACGENVARIAPAPTHAEIANRTSTHREAVTRELNRLAKLGILKLLNREFWVTDVNRLAALVRDAAGEDI